MAVELDGGQHFESAAQAYDDRRTTYLNDAGIEVMRFSNDVIFNELPAVLDAIALALGIAGPSP